MPFLGSLFLFSCDVSANVSSESQCGLSQPGSSSSCVVCVRENVCVVWGGGEALCIELNAAAAISSCVCHRFWYSPCSSPILSTGITRDAALSSWDTAGTQAVGKVQDCWEVCNKGCSLFSPSSPIHHYTYLTGVLDLIPWFLCGGFCVFKCHEERNLTQDHYPSEVYLIRALFLRENSVEVPYPCGFSTCCCSASPSVIGLLHGQDPRLEQDMGCQVV